MFSKSEKTVETVQKAFRASKTEFVPAAQIANLYVFTALQGVAPERDRSELGRLSLAEFLQRGSQPRVLVFDQFEELFTSDVVYQLYGDDWREQQRAFFEEVTSALAADPLLRVVFVMR